MTPGILPSALRAGCAVRAAPANDCLIAASCIELDQPLLQWDRDFARIADVEPRLRLIAA
ncbi:MAG: hypothetical protein J0H15_05140 [Xanthomonadales bacterium]|nr:hypothetical protein [Xanthomonadales bacterium]